MATEVRVPTLGESVTEATVATWFKKPGDAVQVDEMLCELETDKVTIEVPCPVAGAMGELVAAEGDVVEKDGLLCMVEEGAAGQAAPAATAAPAAATPTPAAAAPAAGAARTDIEDAPSAKKAMADAGLSRDQVQGTGRDGRVMKDDVARATAGGASASVPQSQREERVKMTRLRQTIARRLKEAQDTAAMLTTFNEVDMTEVMALRTEYKELFQKKHGVKLGLNYCNVGVAVGTPNGLVVPVLRDAQDMGFAEIEKTIAGLGVKARDGKLSIAEMQGGTFTISNGGVYGSLMSTPILNPPQSGILGMHAIQKRPVVIGDEIKIRPMMYLALSYDHRIVDGAGAVTFLVRIKEALEDPRRLLMDL